MLSDETLNHDKQDKKVEPMKNMKKGDIQQQISDK